ncbi:hypothetical protein GETHOR_25690 [Geothrix oryzae]|uniref:Oligosaccharide repeat unit polymerase n=1 Tax=Geothrix oryzae TaxID=2927975 RepID=A0ABM9M0U3_9BACT|nr:O-antigen polymerase [Geothrix oryzae]BDU70468.1 hypothetical protein GETHOR_25690 [Geothrix oryzae]
MLLLIYFVLIYFLFHLKRGASPGSFLVILYAISLICAVVIGYDYFPDTYFKVFNLVFMAAMLTLLFMPWNRFKYTSLIADPDPDRVNRLAKILLLINSVVFVVCLIFIYYVFTHVTDYSEFKNGMDSEGVIGQMPINHLLWLLAIYLCPTSYFLVPLHFYYLKQRNYKYSILALLFSLNIILNGITHFSRSGFLVFFVMYIVYVPFYYPQFATKAKHIMKFASALVAGLAAMVFYIITASRFVDALQYLESASTQSRIENPILLSLLDYFSQWYKNCNEVMSLYVFNPLYGELSASLPLTFGNKMNLIDYPAGRVEAKLYTLWGTHFDGFNGLISDLLFDFGYMGTLFCILAYGSLLTKFRPKNGVIMFHHFIVLGSLFVFPAMGITSSQLKSVFYELALVYAVIIYFYLKPKLNVSTARFR